jgi:hypothetical protein
VATNIKAQVKRGLLQYLWDGVTLTTLANDLGLQGLSAPISTLNDALMWYQRFVAVDIQSGKTSVGSSGVGSSVHYNPWNRDRAYTQEELFAASQELREVYADAITTLSSSNLPTNDLSIFNAMMADDRMQTVTSTQRDYTIIRMPWSRLA